MIRRAAKGGQWPKGLGLAVVAACLAAAACSGQEEAVSAKAREFKAAALGYLQRTKAVLPRLQGPGLDQKVDQALRRVFREAHAQGAPLPCAVAVLDHQGRVIAGRYPDPQKPEGETVSTPGQNYSRYQGMRQVLQDGRTMHFPLYDPSGELYAVCAPVEQDGSVRGALCLGFDARTIHQDLGVSAKEFLALNFNP